MNFRTLLTRTFQWTFHPAVRLPVDDVGSGTHLLRAVKELNEQARRRIEIAETEARTQAASATAEAAAARTLAANATAEAAALNAARAIVATETFAPVSATASTKGIAEAPGVDLCNEIFRLRLNEEKMRKEGGDSKALRGINRAREGMELLLHKQGIEFFDLTGRKWDARDNDFEPVGQPEEVAGLEAKRIGRCDRPLVKISGKIVQRAKGTVQRPA